MKTAKRCNLWKILTLAAAAVTLAGAANAAEVKELRFMDVIPNAERGEHFQKMVNDYNARAKGVRVVFESTPWGEAHQKLVTQGSTNSMPDVFVMHQQWYAEFISAGWVMKLDDFYDNKFAHKKEYIPYVSNVLIEYDQREARGGVYGLPDGLTTHAMFVRSDWIKEAGLSLESLETWDGIFAAAEALNKPEKNQYGFSYRGGRMGGEQMGMYVMSELGGRVFDDDGKCLFNSEKGKAAIKRYTDIYMKNLAPKDSINWAYSEMVQGFTSGLTGILNQTTEVVATCAEAMREGTWTTVPFPRAGDGNLYSKADSFVLSVAAGTKYPEEAYDFISYMLSPEVNREYCKVNLYIPVMKGAEDDPYFNEGAMSGFVRGMNDPRFVREPYYGYFPELGEFMETIYDAEIQSYLLGQQSLDALCDNISNFLTEKLRAFMKENPNVPVPMPITIK
jgi:multiple sugar transport system substrate-binding protein